MELLWICVSLFFFFFITPFDIVVYVAAVTPFIWMPENRNIFQNEKFFKSIARTCTIFFINFQVLSQSFMNILLMLDDYLKIICSNRVCYWMTNNNNSCQRMSRNILFYCKIICTWMLAISKIYSKNLSYNLKFIWKKIEFTICYIFFNSLVIA